MIQEPFDLFKNSYAETYRTKEIFETIERGPAHKWYRGRIKAGYGALEDGDCFVSWANSCPLIVVSKPDDINGSFRFIISGHMSGSASTLVGTAQEALIKALDSDRKDSDSEWLRKRSAGKSGTEGFLEFYEADLDHPMTLGDFMIPEFMTARGDDDEPPAPRM